MFTPKARLIKMLRAAEGHPEGAASEGWKHTGNVWVKTAPEYVIRINPGFTIGTDWCLPYARVLSVKSAFDLPADTMLEAMEAADKWLTTGIVPENAEHLGSR